MYNWDKLNKRPYSDEPKENAMPVLAVMDAKKRPSRHRRTATLFFLLLHHGP